jgi:hypothetical protein
VPGRGTTRKGRCRRCKNKFGSIRSRKFFLLDEEVFCSMWLGNEFNTADKNNGSMYEITDRRYSIDETDRK